MPDGVQIFDENAVELDMVHVFARSRAELERLKSSAVAAVKIDGLQRVSYPKKRQKSKRIFRAKWYGRS